MIRERAWKYIHWEGFRPQLFALEDDPGEARDLGADPRFEGERARLRDRLLEWLASGKRRTTVDDALVESRTDAHRAHGVHIGVW